MVNEFKEELVHEGERERERERDRDVEGDKKGARYICITSCSTICPQNLFVNSTKIHLLRYYLGMAIPIG